MTHVDIQAKTTKTAAFDGTGVDISGIDPTKVNWTLVLEIMGQNDGDTSRFVFEDSADNFSADILAGPAASVTGKVGGGTPAFPDVKRYSWKQQDFPDLRFGVTSAKLRLSLTNISGSSKSVTYQAYVEY